VDEPAFIVVRKLAALGIVYRGAMRTILEYGFGVFFLGVVGLAFLLLAREKTLATTAIGVYLVFLGLNYVPLLAYSVSLAVKKSAKREAEFELAHQETFRRKYGTQQLLILVPLAVDILAISQGI
jgi:hypothetical protein